jgi:adenylosuccinate lyase
VERVVLPDASILCDYMLGTCTRIIEGLTVNVDRMRQNVDLSRGLFFSEKVLTALVEAGLSRPEAYSIVQSDAMAAWQTGQSFRDVLEQDPQVTSRLSPADIDILFDEASFLRSIDATFERLGLVETANAETPAGSQ